MPIGVVDLLLLLLLLLLTELVPEEIGDVDTATENPASQYPSPF